MQAWFKRMEQPTIVTKSYEVGTFRYFDYHFAHDSNASNSAASNAGDKDSAQMSLDSSSVGSGVAGSDADNPSSGWCQRIRHDFKFEYKFLA